MMMMFCNWMKSAAGKNVQMVKRVDFRRFEGQFYCAFDVSNRFDLTNIAKFEYIIFT